MDLQTLTHPYTPGAAAGPESYLLVWDAPNLDMGLGAIEAIEAAGLEPGKDIKIITIDGSNYYMLKTQLLHCLG